MLIAGELVYNITANSQTNLVNVCENLDWKRQFAINLWYQCLPINSISDALTEFEKCVQADISGRPTPPYIEDSVQTRLSEITLNKAGMHKFQDPQSHLDTCFHLIKLYCDSTHSIEDVIAPLSHCSNQLDYRLRYSFFVNMVQSNLQIVIIINF